MKTVLVTGCSSGFGLETARYFLDREWNVVATMRTPAHDSLPRSDRLRVIALDVTDPDSIRQAVEAAGPIDVLVNNAGLGLLGALEGTSMASARLIFDTNTLGTIAMTRALAIEVPSSAPSTPIPALLTSTSTGPAASTACRMLSGSVTSSAITRSRSERGRLSCAGVRMVATTFHSRSRK